ncbi:MAG: hypothetical protein AAGA12_03830 [Pseudomonadota bacterium]
MPFIVRLLLPLLLILVVALSAVLLLQACGVLLGTANTLARYCPLPTEITNRSRLDVLNEQTRSLQSRIAFLEQELAAQQCTAQFPDPPDVVQLPDPVPPVDVAPEIDRDAWERGDLNALTGCWDLETQLRVRSVTTGRITLYNQWNMCFESDGTGSEIMRATDGATCEGPVSGAFNGAGQLVIEEPANLQCSSGSSIFRRISTCTLRADGKATCSVFQPAQNITSTVRLQRAPGGLR